MASKSKSSSSSSNNNPFAYMFSGGGGLSSNNNNNNNSGHAPVQRLAPQLSRPTPSQQVYASRSVSPPASVTQQITRSIPVARPSAPVSSPQASMFRQAASAVPSAMAPQSPVRPGMSTPVKYIPPGGAVGPDYFDQQLNKNMQGLQPMPGPGRVPFDPNTIQGWPKPVITPSLPPSRFNFSMDQRSDLGDPNNMLRAMRPDPATGLSARLPNANVDSRMPVIQSYGLNGNIVQGPANLPDRVRPNLPASVGIPIDAAYRVTNPGLRSDATMTAMGQRGLLAARPPTGGRQSIGPAEGIPIPMDRTTPQARGATAQIAGQSIPSLPGLRSPPRGATAQIAGQSIPSLPSLPGPPSPVRYASIQSDMPQEFGDIVSQTQRQRAAQAEAATVQRQMTLADNNLGQLSAFRGLPTGFAPTADPGGRQAFRQTPGLTAAGASSPSVAASNAALQRQLDLAQAGLGRLPTFQDTSTAVATRDPGGLQALGASPQLTQMAQAAKPALSRTQMADVQRMMFPATGAGATPIDPNRPQTFASLDRLAPTRASQLAQIAPDMGHVYGLPDAPEPARDTLTASGRAAAPLLLDPLPITAVRDVRNPVAQEILPSPRTGGGLFGDMFGSTAPTAANNPFSSNGNHSVSDLVRTATGERDGTTGGAVTPVSNTFQTYDFKNGLRPWGADWGLNAGLDPDWARRVYQWQQGDMRGNV